MKSAVAIKEYTKQLTNVALFSDVNLIISGYSYTNTVGSHASLEITPRIKGEIKNKVIIGVTYGTATDHLNINVKTVQDYYLVEYTASFKKLDFSEINEDIVRIYFYNYLHRLLVGRKPVLEFIEMELRALAIETVKLITNDCNYVMVGYRTEVTLTKGIGDVKQSN